jgi:hypothetical protein
MFKLNKMIKGFGLAMAVSALMVPMSAFADGGGDTSATVTGGSLSLTGAAPANFAGKSITGVDQTTTAALATFSVSDLTGSGSGWHVTVEASQFTGDHDLAAGSLSMSQPTVASPDTTSPDPTVVTGPYIIDDGAVSITSADTDEGMGTYNFGATTLTLALPADVFADDYASTLTVTIVSAP